MIQELLTIGLPVAKFILAAALMVLFYKLFYKEKATFNHCRIFLLSIALVSLLISQFNIVVYTPPAKIVEIKAPQPVLGVVQESVEKPALFQPAVFEKTPTFQEQIHDFLTVKNSLLLTYILIALVLLVSLFIQFFKIQAAKRKGNVILHDGYEMVMSPNIEAPFSFHKTIFIGSSLTGSKLEMIVKHELWHIKHHHYLDVLVMEILVRIFWFNPILWWVRKELRNVSEFQADRSVLDEGHDLYKYQTIILEEVMAHNPYLANGFNNSFTKKRFIMMKNKCQIRMTTMRRVLLLPFLVGVFSLLSLSVGKSQVKYVTTSTNGNLTVTKTVVKDSLNSSTTTTIDSSYSNDDTNSTGTNNIKFDMNTGPQNKEDIDKAINESSIGLGLAIPELRRLAKSTNINDRKKGLNTVFKSLNVTANGSDAGEFAFSDAFAASITPEVLTKSANNYSRIKTNIDALRKEQSTNAKLTGFQKQVVLLMQDELTTKVLTEVLSQTMSTMMGSMENMMGGAKDSNGGAMEMVKGLMSSMTGALGAMTGNQSGEQNQTTTVDNNPNKTDDDVLKQAYSLKPEQYKEIGMHFVPFTNIYTIEKSETETKVTIVLGISSAHSWFLINRGAKIIDVHSKDEYLLRRVEKGIPMDKMVLAPEGKEKMIAITLIFPPLKESVKKMNIIVGIFTNEEKPEGIPWDFMSVNLDQYLIMESPKIYK